MRNGLLLFLAVLAGCAMAWFLAVRPVVEEASEAAGRLASLDAGGGGASPAPWPGPTEAELADMARAAEALRPAAATADLRPPEGIEVHASGLARGTLEWPAVQELFRWAAAQPRPVRSIEVDALPGDPGRAHCLVVFEEER